MHYTFRLNLSPTELGRYYRGDADQVSVRSDQGQVIRFAARHLRPFVGSDGLHGRFELTTDQDNRFKSLKKLR